MTATDEIAASAAISSERLALFQADLARLHTHFCPRQVLGLRMGILAGEMLGLALPRSDKRTFVFVETDGCLADAISVSTGAWLGHRTLRLIDHGKTAATFVDTTSRDAVRIWPHPEARSRASRYAPSAKSRWHAQRDGYLAMPVTELLVAERVELSLDLAALISSPGRRVLCTRCGEEIVNERQIVIEGAMRCRACAGEAYFRPLRH